jgi:DNA polymerase elongation subunit (family B)
MKIKSITTQEVEVDKNGAKDHNIYIDTDSVFFSATPLMDYRIPNWKDNKQDKIAGFVDEIAGEMQDYLNEFYDVLAKRVFNVDKDKHRLEIKKEYVAKAGIWIAKKRYAQWIIMEKGISVDKLDVKGLDVVRSSFPEAFRELMQTALIDILKDKTQIELRDLIMNFKHEMKTLKIDEIAKNSAVKDLSKYSGADRSPFKFLKGTPAHVKAAIGYNDSLVHFKTAFKYSPMRDGDKIKWAYLRTNPFGLDSMGFKGYEDPKEITDFIKQYVDYDKIFEKELEKKLQDFYDALSWGAVINEQQSAEKFFAF